MRFNDSQLSFEEPKLAAKGGVSPRDVLKFLSLSLSASHPLSTLPIKYNRTTTTKEHDTQCIVCNCCIQFNEEDKFYAYYYDTSNAVSQQSCLVDSNDSFLSLSFFLVCLLDRFESSLNHLRYNGTSKFLFFLLACMHACIHTYMTLFTSTAVAN